MNISGVRFPALLLLCMMITKAASAYTSIPADTLTKWLQCGAPFGYVLIDVRDTVEVRSSTGIIATDSVRPYHLSLNQGVFDRESGRIPSSAAVVIYCRTGSRSATAAQKLTARGMASVYSLSSGIAAWNGSRRDASFIKQIAWLPQFSCNYPATSVVLLSPSVVKPNVVFTDHDHIAGYSIRGQLIRRPARASGVLVHPDHVRIPVLRRPE